MDGGSQIHGWLASRPARFFKKKGRAGSIKPARRAAAFFFCLIWPSGWPANHVFGFPHLFWAYFIGIGILLDTFSSSWLVFFLFVDGNTTHDKKNHIQSYTPKMDGGSQIHGWLASRSARLFKKKAAGRAG